MNMETNLESLQCRSCGNRKLKKIGHGEYICEYCGSRYFMRSNYLDVQDEQENARLMEIFNEAAEYEKKDQIVKELETLMKGLEITKGNSTLMLKLGRAYWRLGHLDDARKYFDAAEELDPNDPVLYNNISLLYISKKDFAKARSYLEQSLKKIEIDPMSVSPNDEAVINGNYGFCLGSLGEMQEAIKYLKIAKDKGYDKDSLANVCRKLRINKNSL